MSDKHNGTDNFEWPLESLLSFDFDSAEEEEGADQSVSQSQPLQPSHHPEADYASPWSYDTDTSASPGLMITSSQYATPRMSPRSTVGASPSSHWAPSPGLMITTSQAASPAFTPLNGRRQSLPTASILEGAYPGINWTNVSSDELLDVYEQQSNVDQPTTNLQSQPLQPSLHPSPNHASPWIFNAPNYPGLMITSSQYANPQLSPRSMVSASAWSNHWTPSPAQIESSSQAASPAFIAPNTNAHTPSSDTRLSRLGFSHQPPTRKTTHTTTPSQSRTIPLSTLPERAAMFIHPGDLQVRSGRTILRLSREILAEIFVHFADNLTSYGNSLDLHRWPDTARYRPETLLLVSRHWNDVATNTPRLWERFYIYVRYLRDFETWKRLARRRFTRFKKDPWVFISINIHTLLYALDRGMPVDQKAQLTVECVSGLAGLVAELAGDDNALAGSWKRFTIRFSPELWLDDRLPDPLYSNAERDMGKILGREMGNLDNIELQGIHWLPPSKWAPGSSLPQAFHRDTKNLKAIRLANCSLPHRPDTRLVQELFFDDCGFWNDDPFGLGSVARLRDGASHALVRDSKIEPLTALSSLHTITIGPLRSVVTFTADSLRVLEVTYHMRDPSGCLASLFYISHITAGNIERLRFTEVYRPGRAFNAFPGISSSEEIKRSIVSFFGSHRRMKEIRGPEELHALVLTSLYELSLSPADTDLLFGGLFLHVSPRFNLSLPKSTYITGSEDSAALQTIARRNFNTTLPCWPTYLS